MKSKRYEWPWLPLLPVPPPSREWLLPLPLLLPLPGRGIAVTGGGRIVAIPGNTVAPMGIGAAPAPGRTVIIPAIAPMPAPPGPGTCPRTQNHVNEDCNQCLQRLYETKTHLRLSQPRGEGLSLLPRGRPRGLQERPEQQMLHHRQLPSSQGGGKRSEDGCEPGVDLLIYPHLVEDLPLEQSHETPAHLMIQTKTHQQNGSRGRTRWRCDL